MSATNRSKAGGKAAPREEADAYFTPRSHALTCAGLLEVRPRMRVLEPSAGTGAFVTALFDVHGVVAEAVERRPEAAVAIRHCIPGHEVQVRTTRFEDVAEPGAFDVIVGNPPYVVAHEHIQHGLYLLREGGSLGFLLRLNFLATAKRYRLFRDHPPWRVYVLPERPDFTGGGGDATEYAFMVWRKGFAGDTVVRWVSTREDRRLDDVARVRGLDWIVPTPNYLQATP